MESVNLPIRGLQHVGIPVTDLRASEIFYQKLGFTKVMESAFASNNGKGTCIMMKLGSVLMELYQLPSSELAEIKNRVDGRIDHIAFDVVDIDAAFAILKTGGYEILQPTPVYLDFWANGCKFFHIFGPDGERLEFNQIIEK